MLIQRVLDLFYRTITCVWPKFNWTKTSIFQKHTILSIQFQGNSEPSESYSVKLCRYVLRPCWLLNILSMTSSSPYDVIMFSMTSPRCAVTSTKWWTFIANRINLCCWRIINNGNGPDIWVTDIFQPISYVHIIYILNLLKLCDDEWI